MNIYSKKLLIVTAFIFLVVGGVKATVVTGTNGANGPVGTLPSGISNLQYEDYSLFVGTKNITISWTGSADGYLVYYLAEEGEPSWYQQRVYWYTKNYEYSEYDSNSSETVNYQRRIVHLDQGPTAKAGNTYSTFYNTNEDLPELSTDPTVSQTGIGWVPSLNPFLVGRSVKWDDPTCWDNDESKPVIKKVALSEGRLTIENVSKSTIVFFTFQDAAGNYYAGPDKLTNSQAAADRHSPLSLLPWNECYISAHLNVPMPVKISWSTEENGTYTEVPAGTDVVFPSSAWVKLELNEDFISTVQTNNSDFLSTGGYYNYDIYYTTTSLLPSINGSHSAEGTSPEMDTYETDRLQAVKYEQPFELTANTVLRFAIYRKDYYGNIELYLGQNDDVGSVNEVLYAGYNWELNEGNETLKYYEQNKIFKTLYDNHSIYGSEGGSSESVVGLWGGMIGNNGYLLGNIPPIQTYLRNNYLWGITFIKEATAANPIAKTFSRPVPYLSWSEHVGGRYGLGTGTYSYETWVSDGDYLVPSSLEGICDFFMVSQDRWKEDDKITNKDEYTAKKSIYLSRINWIPKGMPVIVRYRNYSAPKPLPSSVQTLVNKNNAAAEAELANGLYFHSGCENKVDENDQTSSYSYAHQNKKVLKPVFEGDYDASEYTGPVEYLVYSPQSNDPSTWQFDQEGKVPTSSNGFRWKDPVMEGNSPLYAYTDYNSSGNLVVRYKLYEADSDAPLYFIEYNGGRATQKRDNDGNDLYHKVDAAGNKLYLDNGVETTNVTDEPVETTERDNSNLYDESGFVLTKCDPIIDGYDNEPYAYTTTPNDDPAYVEVEAGGGTNNLEYQDYNNRGWITARIWTTTDASHTSDYSGEDMYNAPVYDSYSGIETKVWDLGGNYFTNIRTLSNTMLTGSSSDNYDFTAEPHTFYLYAGDPEHCQYNRDWKIYHLSTRRHRDEANFLNVLRYSDEPVNPSNGTYYGFSYDHKNEFHPANGYKWAAEAFFQYDDDYKNDYAFSAGDLYGNPALNVSLHTWPFMKRYDNLCAYEDFYGNTSHAQPVVDNWLVYAPTQGDHENLPLEQRHTSAVVPYYYGYGPGDQLRKQSTIGDEEANLAAYDDWENCSESKLYGGWTSAAWRRVTSGTIAAGRPYLEWFGNSFLADDEMPDRDENDNIDYTESAGAKLTFFAGGALSLSNAVGHEDSSTTALRQVTGTVATDRNVVYDLQGRRLGNQQALRGRLAKGVYIVNGKKYTVK